MQVAKYWRNKKLRYRLEGMARRPEGAIMSPRVGIEAERNGRQAPKRESARLPQ